MDFIDRLNYYHKWKWKYMKTTLLTPETDENAIKTAAELIRQGEVVGMPTETVYGLAANALDGEAVKKIFLAKGRPQDNPLIVHIADFDQIYDLCPSVPPQAKQLAEAFWPGPMTMIVPKGDCIPDEVSCGLDTVGIRLPSHPMARALIRESGVPLAAPSANTSGRPSTTTAAHVMRDMDGKIAAVLDGGACGVGVESTVITLALERPRLLRPGGITLEQLRSVLGEVDVDRALYEKIGDDVKVSAPGMKYRHYAPHADLQLVEGETDKVVETINALVQEKLAEGKKVGVICTDETRDRFPLGEVRSVGARAKQETIAHNLFAVLREFDDLDVDCIYSESFSKDHLGQAIMNRLTKAAGYHVLKV